MHTMDNSNSIPAFLMKLWELVHNPDTNHLIYWSKTGKSFIIKEHMNFSQNILPLYYKHNNLASFIRQLNMYGFHKVMSLESGSLRVENDEMEFAHPNFIKDNQDLLKNIRRKMTMSSRNVGNSHDSSEISQLIKEVKTLKKGQDSVQNKVTELKNENEVLWREYSAMRQQLSEQRRLIHKLIQFLASNIYQGPGNPITPKRKYAHLALAGADDSSLASTSKRFERGLPTVVKDGTEKSMSPGGPVIQEITGLEDTPPSQNDAVYGSLASSSKKMDSLRSNKGHKFRIIPHKSMTQEISKYGASSNTNSPLDASSSSGISMSYGKQMTNHETSQVYPAVAAPYNHMNNFSESNSIPVVQSPSESSLRSSPVEDLVSVNIAEVQPHIIIRPSPETTSPLFPSQLSKGKFKKMEKSNSFHPSSTNLLNSRELHTEQTSSKEPSTKRVIVNGPDGKVINVKLASVPSTSMGFPLSSNNVNPLPNVVKDVALVNPKISSPEDLANHPEDVHALLDFLQEHLSPSGGLNLDPATLRSIGSIIDDSENFLPSSSQLAGNELSLYNSSNALLQNLISDHTALNLDATPTDFSPNLPIAAKKGKHINDQEEIQDEMPLSTLSNSTSDPLGLGLDPVPMPVLPKKAVAIKMEPQETQQEQVLVEEITPFELLVDSFEDESMFEASGGLSPRKMIKLKKFPSRGKSDDNIAPPIYDDLNTPQISMTPTHSADMFFIDDSNT